MDKIKNEQNSEPFPGLRKRKAGTLMEHEEVHVIEKRRMQQRVSSQASDCKKVKEDQLEKYIQELETKNKLLLAKCTDLSTLNKKLSDENMELCNKQKRPDSSSLAKRNVQQVSTKPKTVPHIVERSVEILNTQALVALWEEISSIPLPNCSCSKSLAAIKRRANPGTKKYRAYKA